MLRLFQLSCIYIAIDVSVEEPVVNVHRILSSWDEYTVTWNSFNSSYSEDLISSKNGMSFGWQSFNITPYINGWLAGDYEKLRNPFRFEKYCWLYSVMEVKSQV